MPFILFALKFVFVLMLVDSKYLVQAVGRDWHNGVVLFFDLLFEPKGV